MTSQYGNLANYATDCPTRGSFWLGDAVTAGSRHWTPNHAPAQQLSRIISDEQGAPGGRAFVRRSGWCPTYGGETLPASTCPASSGRCESGNRN